MKKIRKKPGPPKTTGKAPLRSLRVPQSEWEAWQAKAASLGLSVSMLIRNLLNRRCK